jgi:probable phosphoglycerate mutase
MRTFLLIRHGLTDAAGNTLVGRTPGVALNRIGQAQAEALPARLQKFPVRSIHSSPLERCLKTAAPLSRKLGLPVSSEPELDEVDWGRWTGYSLADLKGASGWKQFNAQRSFLAAPGGESLLDVQTRAGRLLSRLAREDPSSLAALFSHADVIKAIILGCLSAPLQSVHQIEIAPASISVIEFGEYPPRVLSINDAG